MGQEVMTVPEPIEQVKYRLTGNQWIAIPEIQEDGTILSINCAHLRGNGLLEFNGGAEPFLKPRFLVEGKDITEQNKLSWYMCEHWIPAFQGEDQGGQVRYGGTILTPQNEKGFVYRLWCRNQGNKELKLGAQIEGYWAETNQIVFESHPLNAVNRVLWKDWTNTLVLETRPDTGWMALGILVDHETNVRKWQEGVSEKGHSFVLGKEMGIKPGEELIFDFIVGVNSEADGAAVAAVHIARRGFGWLKDSTESWLRSRSLKVDNSKLKGGTKATLEPVLNRNLFFNYFYTTARTLDSGHIVLLTSRSKRYYVSGAYWARDAFLWSFPAILLVDQEWSRQVLETGFTRYGENGPFHSCYLNGQVLYPGFELDQLAAYFIALNQYIEAYGDLDLTEDWVVKGAEALEKILWQHHNHELYLFSTFLDPSDDQVKHPYLTYSNVLVWKALSVLQKIYKANNNTVKVRHLDGVDRLLKKAIQQHCVIKGPGGQMYAWAVNGKGDYQIYDNPPGSLLLLPYYGFCSPKDKVYKNTLDWIYSKDNQYSYWEGSFPGLGGIHAPYPWVMSHCNGLLAGKIKEGLEFFSRAEMDGGYACETVDGEKGIVKTGGHMASCAGFVAYSIYSAVGQKAGGNR
ncbi:hypothetical protein GGQ84_000580 [Desulfitispora alkaliphila]|uniref:glycoside hydrolase family 125 protein n=1 Tax=Desulfitispora alkaliphila TaxID=622674 RepID=UPI003D235103